MDNHPAQNVKIVEDVTKSIINEQETLEDEVHREEAFKVAWEACKSLAVLVMVRCLSTIWVREMVFNGH